MSLNYGGNVTNETMNKLRGATQKNKNYTKRPNWESKSFTITVKRKRLKAKEKM